MAQTMGTKRLTLIQMGDLHGHLVPRPGIAADGTSQLEGGLARIAAKIEEIRARDAGALLVNTGDTIQGGAETLFTQGQAIVGILDTFGIDAFAPGNWDFVYGTRRFLDLFAPQTAPTPTSPGTPGRWGALAANLVWDPTIHPKRGGQLVLPPYSVKTVRGVRIGIIGFTTERGPMVVGPAVTRGFRFTGDGAELPAYITRLRTQERVDVVVVISELGLARNILLAERYAGVDVLLSSDMHEQTPSGVRTSTGTLVCEAGQDGTRLAEIHLDLDDAHRVVSMDCDLHVIGEHTPTDRRVAELVALKRQPFVTGSTFRPGAWVNPVNGATLEVPIDTCVGNADVDLHRAGFSDDSLPAVLEGSSHDFLTDAFREQSGADIGQIRGFRYGTHVRSGPIHLEDLYHFIPIGPMIAVGTITGQMLRDQIEDCLDGCLAADPFRWTGGWVFGYSGVSYDLDPYRAAGQRASNIHVRRDASGAREPLDLATTYTIAGYTYVSDPMKVGGAASQTPPVVLGAAQGRALDATDVVVQYLRAHRARPEPHRVRLLYPLSAYGIREIQPLKGVPTTH